MCSVGCILSQLLSSVKKNQTGSASGPVLFTSCKMFYKDDYQLRYKGYNRIIN